MPRKKFQYGFTKLEILLVFIIISLLVYLSHLTYKKNISDVRFNVVKYHADIFLRSISAYSAQRQIIESNNNMIFDGAELKLYFNKNGWPLHTNRPNPKKLPENYCEDLWDLVFKIPIELSGSYNENYNDNKLQISSINSEICRYKLMSLHGEVSFFDYHLSTGQVKLSR